MPGNPTETVALRLRAEFQGADPCDIERQVREAFRRHSGARVKDFVPLLVERELREALRSARDGRTTVDSR